ncbi:hypothetical protein K458DRAFT_160737 [Lentithecium fluviatile CBS 122367]|uniref:Uncharacterized protein n=1 Tax=Lentithecium fluviatile CBS 122367 TaxID=1168545 RepID=A0A6G1IH55_9PLEO|nr:hypothetical protein K458DRAFT_160737 [Lentithecium fluviatile CBS 122367]
MGSDGFECGVLEVVDEEVGARSDATGEVPHGSGAPLRLAVSSALIPSLGPANDKSSPSLTNPTSQPRAWKDVE